MYDGSVKFDTKIETTAMQSGLSKLKTMATATFASIGAAGTVAINQCVKAGASFESTMSKVEALSGATAKQMEELSAKAKQMGASTVFSATQAGEAMTYMAQAGWSTSDMLSGLEGVMYLAASAGEDLASVSNIVTDSLTSFGLSASDAAHFADVLAIASAASNTDVAMMGATFKYAAPLAGALGYSIEDVAIATGLMANAGIKAEQAGTSLRAMLSRLASPPKMAAEAMSALGISIKNTDGTAKPLYETLTELREKFALLADTEKTALASQLAGQEAMSGLLAIVNSSDKDFESLTKSVLKADGAAKQMSETMVDNLKGDLVLMQSALEGVEIAVYDSLEEPFRVAAKGATDALSELESSLSGGELEPRVQRLGNSLADFAQDCVDFASGALPGVISAISLLVENLDLLAAAVIGAGQVKLLHAAMATYQQVMGMSTARVLEYVAALEFEQGVEARGITVSKMVLAQMTLKDLAVGVLTGKITLATAAQNLWNAAMNSNPIGLLITALGFLIPLIGTGLKRAVDDSTSSQREFNDSLKEIKDSYDSAIESAEKNRAEAVASAEKVDYLTKKMFELDAELSENSEDTDENRQKKAELSNAVEDLREIIPELNIEIDKETGKLIAEREEVERLTTAYKELMYAKAYQKYYQDRFDAAFAKKAGLEEQLEEETAKLGELPQYKTMNFQGSQYEIISPQYVQQQKNIETLESEISAASAEVDEIYSTLAEWENKVGALEKVGSSSSDAGTENTVVKLSDEEDEGGNSGGDTDDETPAERELRDLRYAYKIGEKSAKDFYDSLERYRDKYLEDGTEQWQDMTLEIKEGRENLSEEEKELLEKELAESAEARKKAIEKELSDNDRKLRRREVPEEEYYDELARIRDEYYDETDEEYAELTDKIIEYNNRLADEAENAMQETIEKEKALIESVVAEIASFADDTLGEVEGKVEDMRQKLLSFGSVTSDADGGIGLANTKADLEALLEYEYVLNSVKGRMKELGVDGGVAKSFFGVISGMSVEEGTEFARLLLEENDFGFSEFINDYAKKLDISERISESLYSDEYEQAVDETAEYMKEAFASLGVDIPEDFFSAGSDSAKRFGEAFLSEIDLQLATIQSRISSFNASLGLGFGGGYGGIFGYGGFSGGNVSNSYSNTYNIINPTGSVTAGLEAAETAATVDRMRNG